jgi:hypothetical protein
MLTILGRARERSPLPFPGGLNRYPGAYGRGQPRTRLAPGTPASALMAVPGQSSGQFLTEATPGLVRSSWWGLDPPRPINFLLTIGIYDVRQSMVHETLGIRAPAGNRRRGGPRSQGPAARKASRVRARSTTRSVFRLSTSPPRHGGGPTTSALIRKAVDRQFELSEPAPHMVGRARGNALQSPESGMGSATVAGTSCQKSVTGSGSTPAQYPDFRQGRRGAGDGPTHVSPQSGKPWTGSPDNLRRSGPAHDDQSPARRCPVNTGEIGT